LTLEALGVYEVDLKKLVSEAEVTLLTQLAEDAETAAPTAMLTA
jgi:hypothetical protein